MDIRARYGMRVAGPSPRSRQIRINVGEGRQKMKPRWNQFELKSCLEKPLGPPQGGNAAATVPQTDTGRRGEEPQVYERTFVKELGKTAVVSSQ